MACAGQIERKEKGRRFDHPQNRLSIQLKYENQLYGFLSGHSLLGPPASNPAIILRSRSTSFCFTLSGSDPKHFQSCEGRVHDVSVVSNSKSWLCLRCPRTDGTSRRGEGGAPVDAPLAIKGRMTLEYRTIKYSRSVVIKRDNLNRCNLHPFFKEV